MRGLTGFIWGIVVAFALILGGGYLYLKAGYFDVSAAPNPGALEKKLAGVALDASVERRAPKGKNPVALTDANLIEAAHEYEEHCALCHGSRNKDALDVGDALSPRAPNLLRSALDDPDGQIYWVIANGIRMTGMPGWAKHLSEPELWKMTLLLKNVDHLPPAVLAEWQKAGVEHQHEGGVPGAQGRRGEQRGGAK